jgi:hypothetical protein
LPEHENDRYDPVAEAERIDLEVDVQTVRAFLGWLLDNSNFKQLDAVMSYCRHWRMAFRHHLGRRIDDRIAEDMKSVGAPDQHPEHDTDSQKHIHDPLKAEYSLSEVSQFRATMNNDDVAAILFHHWVRCRDYYRSSGHASSRTFLFYFVPAQQLVLEPSLKVVATTTKMMLSNTKTSRSILLEILIAQA